MSNAQLVANVINQISTGELELDTTQHDKQLHALTTTKWFQEQWEELCVAFPNAREMTMDQIVRAMRCFTVMMPNEVATIMVSEDPDSNG